MEYLTLTIIAGLAFQLCRTERRLRRLQRECKELREVMTAAEDLIRECGDRERESAKSERLFQEGLQNILNYGVK